MTPKITNVRRDANTTTDETRLANEILEITREHREHFVEGNRVLVIVRTDDENGGRMGLAFEGYDDGKAGDAQVITDLLMLVRAIAQANGIEVAFAPVEEGGDS